MTAEEAFWKDPRGELGGFFEVIDSPWIDQINGYSVATFGTQYMSRSAARHFFIGSKDVSAQFLARDLAVEMFTGQTTDWVHGEHTSSWVQGEAIRRLSQLFPSIAIVSIMKTARTDYRCARWLPRTPLNAWRILGRAEKRLTVHAGCRGP